MNIEKRLFDLIGEDAGYIHTARSRNDQVITDFKIWLKKATNQIIKNLDITVNGDGNQTRSFCYIDDMVEGIYKLLHSNYTKPMNLGNPEEVSLIDFAREIMDMGGSCNKIVFKPLPVNDPVKRKPDITKAIKILNWEPQVSRKKGLKKTFNYFKQLPLAELNKKGHKFG